MKLIRKISLLYSLMLSLYIVLVTVIINPFIVIESEYTFIDLFILFALTFSLSFVFFYVAKGTENIKQRAAMFCLSFSLPIIISGAFVWYLNAIEFNNFVLFISSFFVASILPTLIVLIFLFFKKIKHFPQSGISLNQSNPEISYFELTNAKGKTIFKEDSKDILYFESNDNYVVTYYLDEKETLKKSMDRLSLKSVESMLESNEIEFSRVHKSFLINPTYVKEVTGRSQSYKIKMLHTDTEIPVSRKFDISIFEN